MEVKYQKSSKKIDHKKKDYAKIIFRGQRVILFLNNPYGPVKKNKNN